MSRLTVVLAALIALSSLACTEEPKPKVENPRESKPPAKDAAESKPKLKDAFEQHLDLLRGTAKRTNGVLLTATAEVKGDSIEIKWALDYNGPRPPLIIQKPTYPGNTWHATAIHVAATGLKSEVMVIQVSGPYGPGLPSPLTMEDYITIEKGKSATGTLSVRIETIKERFIKSWPDLANGPLPPEIFVRFQHVPTQRGEQFGLDAWTGGLFAMPVKLSIAKW